MHAVIVGAPCPGIPFRHSLICGEGPKSPLHKGGRLFLKISSPCQSHKAQTQLHCRTTTTYRYQRPCSPPQTNHVTPLLYADLSGSSHPATQGVFLIRLQRGDRPNLFRTKGMSPLAKGAPPPPQLLVLQCKQLSENKSSLFQSGRNH